MRLLIVFFLLWAGPALAAENSVAQKPDILFIAVDDLNDWVGVLGGHPQSQTPNIDELASRGMTFTNAHTVAPSCAPSRTAVLTGVSPFKSGVYGQVGDWRAIETLADAMTLPRYFQESGYTTLGSGKIFHAHSYFESGLKGHQGG